MKRTRLALVSFFAVFLLALSLLVAAWFWRAPLIDQVLRPRLVSLLEERLDAQVAIGSLVVEPGVVILQGLEVEQPQVLRLTLPRAQVRFTLAGLLEGRLAAITLDEPVVWAAAGGGGDSAFEFPARPPIEVDRLAVRGGSFTLQAGGRDWRLRDFEFEAEGQPLAFDLTGAFGAETSIPLAVGGALHWRGAPELELRSLVWDGRSLLASPLRISPGGEGPLLAGRLTFATLAHEDVAHWLAALAIDNPLPPAVAVSLDEPALEFSLPADGPVIDLAVPRGSLAYDHVRLPFSSLTLHLVIDGAIQGRFALQPHEQGPLSGEFRYATSEIEARLRWDEVRPDPLQRLFLGKVAMAAGGTLRLDAEVQGTLSAPRLKIAVRGQRRDSAATPLLDLAPVSADIRLWKDESWQVEGEGVLAGERFIRFRGAPERLKFDAGPLESRSLSAFLSPELLPPSIVFSGLTLSGQWRAGGEGRAWSAPFSLDLSRGGVNDFMARDVRLAGRFEGETLHADVLRAKVSGHGGKGEVRGRGRVAWRKDGLTARIEQLALNSIEYTAPSGEAGLLGGRLELHGDLARKNTGELKGDLAGQATPGEVLKGSFYADLSPLVAEFAMKGDGRLDPPRFDLRSLRAHVPEVGTVEATLSWNKDRIDARGTLDLPDLAAASVQLKPALGESLSALREAEAGGALGAYLSLQRDGDRTRLQGRLQPANATLRWPQKEIDVIGARGLVPFDLHFPPSGAGGEGEERLGEIEFAYLGLGPARLAPRPLRLEARANALRFSTPLVFFISGGTLSLADLEAGFGADGIYSGGRVAAADIDLGLLAEERDWPPVEGRLTADLGRIDFDGGTLTTGGQALIDVFGGRLTLTGIRGEKILSPYPVLTGDIDISGIDLQRLTQTFSFGEIRGVVDGHVRELRLFGPTPTHLTATFESRSRGERSISVKAVRNLTVISQGGLAGVLSKGIYRFIDFYNYRKIGIFCSLENDVFTLRGTAVAGSHRYLVAGGLLPPKIDILAPEHQISFREMVKRLGRIERAE